MPLGCNAKIKPPTLNDLLTTADPRIPKPQTYILKAYNPTTPHGPSSNLQRLKARRIGWRFKRRSCFKETTGGGVLGYIRLLQRFYKVYIDLL